VLANTCLIKRHARNNKNEITYPDEAVVEEEADESGANARVGVDGLGHGIPDDPLRAGAPVVVVAVNEAVPGGSRHPPPGLKVRPRAAELRVRGRQPHPAVEADDGALRRRWTGDQREQGDERHQPRHLQIQC
jgi:hypothetical protein